MCFIRGKLMISINNTLMMVNLSFYMFYISGVDEIEGVIKLISSATYTSEEYYLDNS